MASAWRQQAVLHIGDDADSDPEVPLGGPWCRPPTSPGLGPADPWGRRPHADLPAVRRLRTDRPGAGPQAAGQAARGVHPGAARAGPARLRLAAPPGRADV